MTEQTDAAEVEALAEVISARLHITTDRITGLTHGVALSADTAAVEEAARAVLDSDWLTQSLSRAWEAGRMAGITASVDCRFNTANPYTARARAAARGAEGGAGA